MFRWSARRRDEEPEIPGMVRSGRRPRAGAPRPVVAPPTQTVRDAMLCAVREETWLNLILDGLFLDDRDPWWDAPDLEACSAQLLRWYAEGPGGGYATLHATDLGRSIPAVSWP